MPLSFSVSIEPAHVRAATAGIFRRQALQPKIVGGFVALVLLSQALLRALVPQVQWSWHAASALLMLGSFGLLAWLISRHYEGVALKNFALFHGQPAQVRLDEAGYHFDASWGRGSIAWDKFESLWRFSGVWVLLQHVPGGFSVLLPADALDEEARAFICAKVKG